MTLSAVGLLLVQFIVIIGLSRLLGRGMRWMGQPLVIAEVLAGILLGPSLLGWLWPEAMDTLFPASSTPVLKMISQVGLILFMFLIGLELDPRLLRGRGHASVVISHTSIVAPFALGAGAAYGFYPRLSEASVPFSSFVLFMGVAMSITAFPVLARILTERRLMHSKVGALAITCAAVDDVTAWCLLAFVVSIVRATHPMQAALTTLIALGYIAFMLAGVRPFLARLGARVASREGLNQGVMALTLLMLLASALATEMIGIHALFGSFLFGAIIPKEGGLAEALAEKLEDVAVVLLLPLFFAFSGLRTQIGLLNTPENWAMCGLIILLACLGKFGGSALAARFTGSSWREAGAIGVLMNTRGLMELIVLNLGLDLGVISPTLFTMMVVMALVTTFLTTPLLRVIYPPEELALERAVPVPLTPDAPAPFRLLFCVSHGQTGPGMVTLGQALTGGAQHPSELYALHLIPPSERASFLLRNTPEARGQPRADEPGPMAPIVEQARKTGLEVRPLSFMSAEPALDICRTAEAKKADLIVLGWHKPLFGQTVLGGTVHEVMREASADVAVLVDRGLRSVRRVLVPFNGSRHDRAALGLARRLRSCAGVEVTVLHVTSPALPHGRPTSLTLVQELFPESSGGVHFKVVAHASPEDAVLAEAATGGYDLVVVGVGAEWGLEGHLFGLHRERIVRDSKLSLLVVRQPRPEEAVVPADESAGASPALRQASGTPS
ncbi:cation:proton antiporter domain-containing protein [Melittangium boletus]|uniref:cation:proton antiporter domain-containing protein n=1 Tax=Melittangium boletus TaxID=83453 RepID=UPI003DA23C95